MPIQVWGSIIPPYGPALAQRHFGAIDSFKGEGLRVVVARTLCHVHYRTRAHQLPHQVRAYFPVSFGLVLRQRWPRTTK